MKESRDILSLFEALNSHEVFTPPRVARQMLDLLPSGIWSDPSIKILDPCTKSGVFLREAFYRLFTQLDGKGLYETENGDIYDLDDKQQRINHILENMLFGIATSELTSYVARRTLYGVMRANSDKQLSAIEAFEQSSNFHQWTEREKYNFIGRNKFNEYFDHNLFCTPEYEGFEQEGNIFYPNDEVKKLVMEEDDYEIEDKYFPFIEENTKHKKILDIRSGKMKFDVIIGNPPYQKETGGFGKQAKPIYNLFIELAIKLNPNYITMITPSRWFSGGMGLSSFRAMMMSDKRLSSITDFPNSKDCFPGVSISGGVNYFLWNKLHNDCCSFTSMRNNSATFFKMKLDDYGVIVRYKESKEIIDAIKSNGFSSFSSLVSPINAFDLSSSFRGSESSTGNDVKILHSKGYGFMSRKDFNSKNLSNKLIDKYKVVVSRTVAEHANEPSKSGTFKVLAKTLILPPETACTHSYLVVASFDNMSEAESCLSFLQTKFVRFLILQTLTGIDLSSSKFEFVPCVKFDKEFLDVDLYKKYNLTEDSINHIEGMVRAMSGELK